MTYDTAAIRRVARKLDSIASSLKSELRHDTRTVHTSAGSLKGSTATAIEDEVNAVQVEFDRIGSGIIACALALRDYADKLDETDAKAGEMISSH